MLKPTIILFFFFGFFTSCEEEIDYDDQVGDSDKLVVLGWITDEAKPQTVKLVKMRSVSESESEKVSGAEVYLHNQHGSWELKEVNSGVYKTDSSWKATSNDTMRLTIQWNENEFTASSYMAPVTDFEPFEPQSSKELGIELRSPDDNWPVLLFLTNRFGYNDAARWEMRLRIDPRHAPPGAPDTLIESEPEVFFTHPALETNGLLSLESIDRKIVPDSTLLILSKFSLSDEGYDYYRSVLTETDWSGRIYSTIPGNVPSNLSNGAIGFFGASAVLTKTRILHVE